MTGADMTPDPSGKSLQPLQTSQRQQRVLLFGGTFNPIHNGHLRSALECQYLLGFDEVWLIPNAQQPLKGQPTIAAEQRLAMINLAIEDYPQLRCVDIEILRGEISYTIDTIAALQKQFPEVSFAWQLGQDALNQFDRWHRWQELIELASWIVVPRPGYRPDYSERLTAALADRQISAADFLRKDSAGEADVSASAERRQYGKIISVSTTEMALSSTHIRQLANHALPCDFLVPDSVSRYIAQQHLYR